jgi:hypothetical protein
VAARGKGGDASTKTPVASASPRYKVGDEAYLKRPQAEDSDSMALFRVKITQVDVKGADVLYNMG